MLREIDFFRHAVPQKVLESITRAIYVGCRSAHRTALRYGPERRVDAVPSLRRLEVEDQLGQLVLGSGYKISRQRTPSSTYTRIENERVIITPVTRTKSVQSVKPYRYRETLARAVQLELFTSPEPLLPEQKLYGLLVYGGDLTVPEPTQARIVFPLPDGAFLPEEIDLLREFPALASNLDEEAPVSATGPVIKVKATPKTSGDE